MKKIVIAGTLSFFITASVAAGPAITPSTSLKPNAPPLTSTTRVRVNINQADATHLAHLVKGIGEKRAEAVVQYREQHGPFKSIADLAYVPGLGSHFVKQHQDELEQVFSVN